MPDKYDESSIENCVLTSSNGEIYAWQGIKDVTSELENENTNYSERKISFSNNLECCFEFRLTLHYRKRLERLQFSWTAPGPIRKRLWWNLFRKYKFNYYIKTEAWNETCRS